MSITTRTPAFAVAALSFLVILIILGTLFRPASVGMHAMIALRHPAVQKLAPKAPYMCAPTKFPSVKSCILVYPFGPRDDRTIVLKARLTIPRRALLTFLIRYSGT